MSDVTVTPFPTTHVGRPGNHHRNNQWIFEFPNGFSASVVSGPYAYGGEQGKWELAVMDDHCIRYDTPITSDVIGWLDESEVAALLDQIAALPAA